MTKSGFTENKNSGAVKRLEGGTSVVVLNWTLLFKDNSLDSFLFSFCIFVAL